ncbi:MAG: DUF349 domain-containing protein [Rhodanobacteraceae bacterium]
MKLSGFLNKPRWQSRETAVRRAGVAEDDDAELLASLSSIARQDADAGVRTAAMKRLADPGLTQRLATEDTDAGVRTEARKLWLDLLAGNHLRSPSPVECARLLRAQDDAALIEHVARNARDASLRAAALARVTRSALLADRATSDPDPEIRIAALERIDDEALLVRLAERTRKTDKKVSRGARERADALRIGRGDADAVEALARTLCERIERLAREGAGGDAQTAIDVQWSAIEARAGESLRTRYQAARALIIAARERPAVVAIVSAAPVETIEPVAESVIEEPAAAPSESAAAIVAEPEAAAEAAPVDAPRETARTRDPQEDARREAIMQKFEEAVSAFEAAVEAGVVARAHAAHAELGALRKAAGSGVARGVQRRLADAERQYEELSRWQHWSDNQRRRQLCESIEALTGSGLHPDAIATRVREAQTEWSRLDAAEGHAEANHAMHGWARRFHAACRHALEPAKSYFKKRQEVRKGHSQAIATALADARTIPSDSTDWPAIAKARHAVVDALRALDRVDPHERKTFARDLKATLTALDERVSSRHSEVEHAKSALIAEAQALTAGELPRGAVAAARALQERWRGTGNGRRDRDQAQWKTFRAALDAVFGKLDAERTERTARDAGARSRAAELVGEIEAIAKDDALPQRATIARIGNEWDALGVRDDALVRRYRAAHAALRDGDLRRDRASRRNPYDAWFARYRLCRAVEKRERAADDVRADWESAPAGDIAVSALAARFDAALNGNDIAPEDGDSAHRDVLIRIEIFAGLESPPEDHERRREVQIERLSARMRGGATSTAQQELAALLHQWTVLAPSPALDARFDRAFAAAIGTLP